MARLESGERRIDVVEFLLLAEAIGFDPVKMLKEIMEVEAEKITGPAPPSSPRRSASRKVMNAGSGLGLIGGSVFRRRRLLRSGSGEPWGLSRVVVEQPRHFAVRRSSGTASLDWPRSIFDICLPLTPMSLAELVLGQAVVPADFGVALALRHVGRIEVLH